MNRDFLTEVQGTISKFHMAKKSQRLLVALSGGADSVALLLCLYELGYDIAAVHINHQLRGEESFRDENFCRDICENLGVELTVKRIDVKAFCTKNSLSVEEGARILRYKEFDRIECDKICTAHNLNDCLETAIFNLARGSGLKGIASIPPVRGKIIRPLIECSRGEIEGYLETKGQGFVTDSTNLQTDYSRNKIRHSVIPQLEKINSSLYKTYRNTLNNLREDSDFIEKCADEAFEKVSAHGVFDSALILALDISVRRRVIIRILKEKNVEISNEKIMQLENLMINSGKLNIRRELFAICESGKLWFETKRLSVENEEKISIVKVEEGSLFFGKREITFKVEKNLAINENVHKKFANCCLDYDKIKGELFLRTRQEGDKIRLVNRDFNSDVRKLVNKAFPLDKREEIILIADDQGVVFLENYGAAERVKIDENTKSVLYFSFENLFS